MADLIGSIVTPGLQPGTAPADKNPVAGMENPPAELEGLKPGDNLMLQVLNRGTLTSLQANIKISVNQKLLELPLTLNLDKPLTLPADIPAEVVVQVSSRTPDKLSFKLVNIDNQPVERFLAAPQKNITPVESGAVIRSEPVAVSLAPLKLAPLLGSVVQEMPLPENIKTALLQNLPEIDLQTTVKNQIAGGSLPQETAMPLETETLVSALREAVKTFVAALPRDNGNLTFPEALRPQLQNELASVLKPLLNMTLPAEVAVKGEGRVAVLSTPLGDIFPETPLKLPAGTALQLTVRDLLPLYPSRTPFSSELQAGHKLIEGLVSPRHLLQALKPNPPAQDLLRVLEPLRRNEPALYRQILDKIPADGTKMVSNMVSYLKAAGSGTLADWIGHKAVEQLRAAGSEGQEALQRLNDFVSVSQRESPTWRQVEIPFFSGEMIGKIRVAVKKNQDEEAGQEASRRKKGGTRFVIDTSFSRLGNFQFDGFSLERERRFDLIIRTEKAIPQGLIAEMMRLFKTGLHQVDYVGNININVKEKFIKVCEDNGETAISRDGIYI